LAATYPLNGLSINGLYHSEQVVLSVQLASTKCLSCYCIEIIIEFSRNSGAWEHIITADILE
jgi:hypothetical protein